MDLNANSNPYPSGVDSNYAQPVIDSDYAQPVIDSNYAQPVPMNPYQQPLQPIDASQLSYGQPIPMNPYQQAGIVYQPSAPVSIEYQQYPQSSPSYIPTLDGTTVSIPPTTPSDYPSPTFSADIRDCDILAQEIKEISILDKVRTIKFKNKLILFIENQDADLFYTIFKYAQEHPESTRKQAMEQFLRIDHSDAIINIVYEHKVEAMMIYSTKVKDNDKRPTYRAQFIVQMLLKRLFLVFEISQVNREDRVLALYASFETMAYQAELQQFRFQLGVDALKRYIPDFGNANESRASIAKRPLKFLTDMVVHFSSEKRSVPFEYEKIADFKEGDMERYGARVKEFFFSPENRIQLIHAIVTSTSIQLKHNSSRRSSIRELIDSKIFLDYYFLHDHRIHGDVTDIEDDIRDKMKLWSKKLFSFKGLPLIEIRRYFGENVAFYFAWLDFYTKWFKSLSVIGIIATGYGGYKYATTRTNLALLFDNEATPYFAFLISVWSLLFLKFWKRKANYLRFVWDMDNIAKSEQIRVEWRATTKQISPVTGKPELYEALWIQEGRRFIAGTAMLLAFVALCALIGGNLAFTGWLFNSNVVPGSVSGVVGTSLFTILQIGLVAPLYAMLVVALNNFENYKTQTGYLSNLVWKQFIMCFINSFGMLYFTSMVKPVTDELDPNVKYFGYYVPKCVKTSGYSSCFSDLAISIAIVFGAQQYLYTGFQLVYPSVMSWWTKRSSKEKGDVDDSKPAMPYYMKQFFLAPVTLDLLSSEYSTKVIQLGYVLLFSAAFPLAPVLAWFNNIVEIRVDLWKFLKLYRRPFVESADAINAWQQIITGIVYLSTISNSVIIAFTSNTLEEYFSSLTNNTLSWKLGFIIIFEHILLLIAVMIDKLISDVPEAVRTGRAAEEYLERLRADAIPDDLKSNGSI